MESITQILLLGVLNALSDETKKQPKIKKQNEQGKNTKAVARR